MDINEMIEQVDEVNKTNQFDEIKSKLDLYLNSQEYKEKKQQKRIIEKARKDFVNKFNVKYIKVMPVDNYIIECLQRKESFCYMLERDEFIGQLGSIRGSYATSKFGLHKSKDKTEPDYVKKFGDNANEAYKNIIQSILDLLYAAKKNDYNMLQQNKLAPMFKSKIYFIYYPNKSIPINDKEEIIFFLKRLGYNNLNERNFFLIKKLLLRCKEILAPNISNWEFMNFLYSNYGYRTEIDDLKEIKKNIDKKIEQIKLVNISLLKDLPKKTTTNHSQNLPDYELAQKKRTAVGMCGEDLVLRYEKENNKKFKNKIENVSNINCGYDILSFDDNGNEKHIEVKTSVNGNIDNINFYLTANEYKRLETDDSYYIYYVCVIKNKHKTIYSIQKKQMASITKEPVIYQIKAKGLYDENT